MTNLDTYLQNAEESIRHVAKNIETSSNVLHMRLQVAHVNNACANLLNGLKAISAELKALKEEGKI